MDEAKTPEPLVRPLDPAAAAPPRAAPAPPRPAKAHKAPRRRRRVPRAALLAAVAAAVAVALVWSFAVRDPGNPFQGTWAAPAGAPISGTVVVSGPGRHIEATFAGADTSGAAQSFTVRAHRDGEDLVVTADDFADAAGDVADAQRVRDTFAAYVKDFRLVFSPQDAAHLKMTVEGVFVGVIKVSLDRRTVVLTKVD
jgi:hypothetical protein